MNYFNDKSRELKVKHRTCMFILDLHRRRRKNNVFNKEEMMTWKELLLLTNPHQKNQIQLSLKKS